jgi:hypothetical protein
MAQSSGSKLTERRVGEMRWYGRYVSTRPVTASPSAQVFVTRRGSEYTKNSLAKISERSAGFCMRQLQDMRRTGAVAAQSGGADLSVISQKWRTRSHRPHSLRRFAFRSMSRCRAGERSSKKGPLADQGREKNLKLSAWESRNQRAEAC